MKLLVAGGAGFIGSNFTQFALRRWPDQQVVVLDALTYAGNLENLTSVKHDPRFSFVHGNICDAQVVRQTMQGCDRVVNFAAETHVDRSILDSTAFIRTDIEGTRVLLEGARDLAVHRFLQVSTDEVYGHIEAPDRSIESDPLRPRSPYAASKAGGDLMVGAYYATYGVPALLTRGANTYGPFQYPEKIIPLFITNALQGLPLPVYGDGRQVRDWIHVSDHCEAIATVLDHGEPGEIYNVGAGNERPNLEVVEAVLEHTNSARTLVRHVPDRPGHDRRYALAIDKMLALGWEPKVPFREGLEQTVEWYRENSTWWERIKGGAFQEYYREQYERRLAESHT